MSRVFPGRRASALLAACLLLAGAAPANPPRPAAREPATARLHGLEYVNLHDLAARYGMEVTWQKPREQLRLHSQWTELVFELNKRELRWNGLRVFLGEPIAGHRRTLWVAAEDVRTMLVPLLQPAAIPAPGPLRRIVLDPGHGGTDPGTQNERLGLKEKDFTLDVAQRLRPLLEARGFEVRLTRETDTRFSNNPAVDLPMRADFANKAGADLFLSIHFNALAGNADVRGVETYSFTPAGLRSTAADERSADDKIVHPVNRHDHWSAVLAAAVHRRIKEDLDAFDRGLKRARWGVLRRLECPGILIEGGFLSNDAEARLINTPAYRQKLAEAIARAVDDYAARIKEAPAAAKP